MNPLFGEPVPANPLFGGGDQQGGGYLSNVMQNPLFLASLQMFANNEGMRRGQNVNTFSGIPQMIMAGTQANEQRQQKATDRQALALALRKAGFSEEEARGLSMSTTAASAALQQRRSQADDTRADKQFALQQQQFNQNFDFRRAESEREQRWREQEAAREQGNFVAKQNVLPPAPSGYRWSADGSLAKIPGGPAEKEATIAPENAGRAALTKTFLDDVPNIRKDLHLGSGFYDRTMAVNGWGRQGEIERKIQSGADALFRALTGAGTNASEATEKVKRYLPSLTDTEDSLRSKFEQLTTELVAYEKNMYQGRAAAPDRSNLGVPRDGTPPENMSRAKASGSNKPLFSREEIEAARAEIARRKALGLSQ